MNLMSTTKALPVLDPVVRVTAPAERYDHSDKVLIDTTHGTATIAVANSRATNVAAALANVVAASNAERAPVTVAFLYFHSYNVACEDERALQAFLAMDHIYPDGVGLQIARFVGRLARFPRVSGTDTVPLLLMSVFRQNCRVFLLGGTPELLEVVGRRFAELFPNVDLVGSHHGYFSAAEDPVVVEAVNNSRPDILLVGMGTPRQELWLHMHEDRLSVRLAICVGGLFHYWSQDLSRAPVTVRTLGLEWLWILAQQPHKWRVYTVGAARFLARVVRAAWAG
jgi:exopolysaccharide biosynthesis WecB/TagA/CpsF family protein